MNTQTATEPLTVDERVVYDSDEYLGNIMMDGHLLTFCNTGRERINEIGAALERVGAAQERALLDQALLLWAADGDVDYDDADDALTSALDAIDEQFFAAAAADDSLEHRTKQYVRSHLDAFVVLE